MRLEQTKKEDLRPYRRFGMTLLQMMSLFIALGLIVHFLFS